VETLSPRERGDVIHAYLRRLSDPDPAVQREAALAWNLWEERASHLLPKLEPTKEEDVPKEIALARIEAHYFVNDSFFNPDDQLLRDVGKIRHLPGLIVQGRWDIVCPPQSAWELHRAWPGSVLRFVGDAGHAADEPGISSALVEATEEFKGKV